MFQKTLAAFFVFVFLTTAAFAKDYADVPGSNDFYIPINYFTVQKVFKGYEGNLFKPTQAVNRAEALKSIFLTLSIEPSEQPRASFSDIKTTDWFAPYVSEAKRLKLVTGNQDGTFHPLREVTKAEFVKMLLLSNQFKPEKWGEQTLFKDVTPGQWFSPYMNYAGHAGLLHKDSSNALFPNEILSRGEVAEILYRYTIIRHGKDVKFLSIHAQANMSQVEVFLDHSNSEAAKRTSELAVDLTQQSLKVSPGNGTVLSMAKLARAYDLLVRADIASKKNYFSEARDLLNQAITKATEAWNADHDSQPLAKHVKDRANALLLTFPGAELPSLTSEVLQPS